MKKYYNIIAICAYILAAVLYVSSLFSENRVLLMCFGSAVLCFGAVLMTTASKKK